MKQADDIKKMYEQARFDTRSSADEAVLKKMKEIFLEVGKSEPQKAEISIWSKFMKSKLTKLAAAAVIIAAVIIGLNFLGVIGKGGITWADVIKPIFTAKTAKFDMIIGNEETGTVITDMVKGSRINRKVGGVEHSKIVIDLETSQVVTFDEINKTVMFIDLKNLPQIPNYLEHLRNVINQLQNVPGFEVKKLGEKNIDGVEAVGFQASGPGLELTIWANAQTAYPVRIEQQENNMNIISKNFQFDLEMDDSLFSIEVPPDYKEQKMTLDLTGSTEEDFIAGLKMFAQISEDKTFLPDVSIEYITKNAVQIGRMIENSGLSQDEQVDIGYKFSKMVLFIRFFNIKNEGQWHYTGVGVELGDAAKAIFWYKPKDSQTWRVIYGDLHVEDVAEKDLPQTELTEKQAGIIRSSEQWEKQEFIGGEKDTWHITASSDINVVSDITLEKVSSEVNTMYIKLPYSNGTVVSATFDNEPVNFEQINKDRYALTLPLDKMAAGQNNIVIKWSVPLDALKKEDRGYRVRIQALIPSHNFLMTVVLEPLCGFEYTPDPSQTQVNPFSFRTGDNSNILMELGSCLIEIAKSK